ncbi:MAG: hypothetical protein HY686_06815 [Chloroflexi bacterium]|nr:hypothetical protein [Chloroflexota bacterium]
MKCEFSLHHYQELIQEARRQGYHVYPFSTWMQRNGVLGGERTLLLRHDIDVSVERAVQMATVEAALGIQATYFVRLHARYYDLQEPATRASLNKLAALAELGLHYERYHYAQNGENHLTLLLRDAEELRRLAGMAMLGGAAHMPRAYPPFSEEEVRAAGLAFEAYAPAFTHNSKYLSDSSRKWQEGCLCNWLGVVDHLYVLVHPVWWTDWEEPSRQVIARLRAGD